MILKVLYSKPKGNKVLTIYIKRGVPDFNSEVIHTSNLTKYGYSEWKEMVNVVSNNKSSLY